MWKRFAPNLRCVICEKPVELIVIDEHDESPSSEDCARGERAGLSFEDLSTCVDAGLFVCRECGLWFPVLKGLPIFLPYTTDSHREFEKLYSVQIKKLGKGYSSPHENPVSGEEYVLQSFSREWSDYSFDEVLWTWTYEERRAIFLAEIGASAISSAPSCFLEIGCGIGVVTSFASDYLQCDAVGVDLSLAAMRAAERYRHKPFMHFIQASLWRLPFSREFCDVLYSHGVLHHTCDTERAFKAVAPFCKKGGIAYIWVYGPGSINESFIRRAAYSAEAFLRPHLARMPSAMANVVLTPIALGYMGVNMLQRLSGQKRQAYNFSRALHAVRDRFTPLYAHRVKAADVAIWFKEAGFDEVTEVLLSALPESAVDTFRRNVGMRGKKHFKTNGGAC